MINRRIEAKLTVLSEEYGQLQDLAHSKEQKSEQLARMPLLGGFLAKRSRLDHFKYLGLARKKAYEITDILRIQIGSYPLAWCNYHGERPFDIPGFSYGFNYPIGDNTFQVEFFRDRDSGILVQGHEATFQSQVEIRREHPHNLLHLPQGFIIPVGPFRFDIDDMPVDENTLQKQQEAIDKFLEGQNDYGRGLFLAGFSGLPTRFAPARYFNWQPELPDRPQYIMIDKANIPPQTLGLSPETAPTYTNTTEGVSYEGVSYALKDEKYFKFIEDNCKLCRTLSSSKRKKRPSST